MPEVFLNTTPLQYLHRLGHLEWLRDFYGRVIAPMAVALELREGRRLGARVPSIEALPWIEVRAPVAAVPAFPRFIHRGEAEVLALAAESDAALVVIDDLLARGLARKLGLRVAGTLGIILRAKSEGRIDAVAPLMDQLEQQGFHVAAETRAEVLRLAGE